MFQKEHLHHTHLIEGQKDEVIEKLHAFFTQDLGISIQGNPDYSYEEFDSIGIDDARLITAKQQRKAAIGEKKIFVIVFNSITREAQNALLKAFEEPTIGTHFFLITHSASSLLPTLKSRVYSSRVKDSLKASPTAERFLKESAATRLKVVKKIIDSDTPKADALQFISDIEKVLQQKIDKEGGVSKDMSELYKVKSYLNDTSASVKMLLEHLSLVLPQG